jgi:CheY-like chemotaxis protein
MADSKAYKKVMVIDDNEVDRYIASRNIRKYGFADEVVVQDSARSALQYLLQLKSEDELPHLIFLDVRMPELDGFGFLREYEKLPGAFRKNCIVMMLTTSLNCQDHETASKNRFIKCFVSKPLDQDKLTMISAEDSFLWL